MKPIKTIKAPQAIGPYAQAIDTGTFLFVSGQIPLHPETGTIVSESIEVQTKQVMENLRAILEEAQLTFNHVVKTTIFLTDLNNFSTVNTVYGSYFTEHKPARACVEVSKLPKEAKVEIELIAIRN